MPQIGVLVGGSESDSTRQKWMSEFRSALQRLGWTDGHNVQMTLRWGAADRERAALLAAELVARKPDVLFADNTFVAQALQKATRTVPIVFARISDPISSGFVGSLARPGGNMTGFSNSELSSYAKFVEFTKEIAPNVTRIGIVISTGPRQDSIGGSVDAITNAATSIGMKSTVVRADSENEVEDAIAEFGRTPNGGLIMPGDPATTAHRKLIFALAARYKLPVIGSYPFLAADGGLLAYAAATREQYEGAARYVDRILRGEMPAELPVQQPTKYELSVNLKTAKSLGLSVPPSLLAIADEVIE
jgi:putative ABC transport system substrate-binding protein